MDPQTRNKINELISEANRIAMRLEEISNGINSEFKGVGANFSRTSLQELAQSYRQLANEFRKQT